MRYILPIIIFIVFLISLSCAKQTVPDGGPKDTIPPVLVRIISPTSHVNYNGEPIVMEFSEYLLINNPREQLLISPPVGKDVELTSKKKTATLKLNSQLESNTTYTINFRESIQDITEKNPAQNLQLALSTGSYIDSLSIKGSVKSLLTLKPIKEPSIALYSSDTFNIFKDKPNYLTKADKYGKFILQNLKPNKYFIYAFTDKNKNLIVDSKSEEYGIEYNSINLTAEQNDSITIKLFSLDARPFKLTSARPYNTYFNIKTSKSIVSYSLKKQDSTDTASIYSILANDKTSINVYSPNANSDSIAIQFSATDSLNQKVDTIIYFKKSARVSKPEEFKVSLKNSTLNQITGELNFSIEYNKPIKTITYDSIIYILDSLHTYSFHDSSFTWNKSKIININTHIPPEFLQPEKSENIKTAAIAKNLINKLKIGKMALLSIEGDSSKSMNTSATILGPSSTGTIKFQINSSQQNVILQLLNTNYEVIATAQTKEILTFQDIKPGDYYARIIIDSNNNGQWDPGNPLQKQPPEEIFYYTNEKNKNNITIKANWELGPLLITIP